MAAPDFAQAWQYALHRLEHELPDYLTYHCIEHTRDDVVVAVNLLAERMGVTGEQHMLLETGAYFHDLGFIYQVQGHESVGVAIAREVLPAFGYSDAQIDVIEGIIMATQMPQQPEGLLQEIIADADMDSLGRADFFEVAARLRAEMAVLNQPMDDIEWYTFEITFLSNHHYFTEAARELRDAQKQRNLEELRHRLTQARSAAD
ncbi:MAG: phosphohydrolase [Chloroflexota bacterium]